MTSVTLGKQLAELGLYFAADNLDDLVARATKHRWGATELLGYLAVEEAKQRVARGVERRLANSRLPGRLASLREQEPHPHHQPALRRVGHGLPRRGLRNGPH